jgi:hypothetical protein
MELAELGIKRDGYPALAEWISRDPDHETFIFRRFDRLAARNLLNLQSELVALEDRLDRMDAESRLRRDVGLRCWETFEEEANHEANQSYAKERRRLYDELERRIKEYRELNANCEFSTKLAHLEQKKLSFGNHKSLNYRDHETDHSRYFMTGSMAKANPEI